jgi:hypothetical protein
MASDETSGASASRDPPIIGRDGNGVERELIVSVLPAGLVVLRDSGNDQVLSPKAAIEQALELIHATSLAGQGSGPLSSTY